MTEKTINIESITIRLRKSPRARNIIISVKPYEGAIVAVPHWVSYLEGERVAREKIEWIREHLEKMRKIEKDFPKYDEYSDFSTRNHRLRITQHTGPSTTVRVSNGLISVKYSSAKNVHSFEVQKAVRKGITAALRKEAKDYLPKRLNELSLKFGLSFNQVFIKNLKSRWGSCSHRNNINLNMQLLRLPDHIIDYVILHELAHTIVRNHSKKYWAYLDKLVGDAKKLDKELRKYSISLSKDIK